jgi:hypothetical protein
LPIPRNPFYQAQVIGGSCSTASVNSANSRCV